MTQYNLTIKSWSVEDRPREKLLLKGKKALSNAELVAILIGSGSRDVTAVTLAKKILNSVENNLGQLGKMDVDELMKFKGIGKAKAVSIAACMELGRRRKSEVSEIKPAISSSRHAYEFIRGKLQDLQQEEFHVIFLNTKGVVIRDECIGQGGVSGTFVDAKVIFKKAMYLLATKIILAHNHPSGGVNPSRQDIALTKKLIQGANLLDIRVDDHIIIGDDRYFSFADEQLI